MSHLQKLKSLIFYHYILIKIAWLAQYIVSVIIKNSFLQVPLMKNIIIYKTVDGKASVSLYAKDGMVWMNQNQIAELFDTSVPNISIHISNILKKGEVEQNSVIKEYLTTGTDGKKIQCYFLFSGNDPCNWLSCSQQKRNSISYLGKPKPEGIHD